MIHLNLKHNATCTCQVLKQSSESCTESTLLNSTSNVDVNFPIFSILKLFYQTLNNIDFGKDDKDIAIYIYSIVNQIEKFQDNMMMLSSITKHLKSYLVQSGLDKFLPLMNDATFKDNVVNFFSKVIQIEEYIDKQKSSNVSTNLNQPIIHYYYHLLNRTNSDILRFFKHTSLYEYYKIFPRKGNTICRQLAILFNRSDQSQRILIIFMTIHYTMLIITKNIIVAKKYIYCKYKCKFLMNSLDSTNSRINYVLYKIKKITINYYNLVDCIVIILVSIRVYSINQTQQFKLFSNSFKMESSILTTDLFHNNAKIFYFTRFSFYQYTNINTLLIKPLLTFIYINQTNNLSTLCKRYMGDLNKLTVKPIYSCTSRIQHRNTDLHCKKKVSFDISSYGINNDLHNDNYWPKKCFTTQQILTKYIQSCKVYQIEPLNTIIQQIRSLYIGEDCKPNSTFSLYNNRITVYDVESMEHIFKWVKFHTLDLSCAELDYDVYVILFEIISYYDTFKKIKIKFNKISQALCIQFTKMLKNTPCIDIIEICNGTLPLVFWDLLRMRMADNWTLKEIMLNNVPLSNKCLSFLANTICSSNHVKLKKLYLRNAKLVSVIQGDTIALIAKNCHSLQYLDLSGNNLSQKLNLLFQVLSTGCSNIKILYLMNNSLSEPDFKQLSQIKSTCPLNYLCLDSNNLSGSSFHHIVDLINSNDSIIYLSMVNCKLCDYEAISLAETIHDNGTLQNINISCNNFGLAGIIALERAIQFNNIILYIAITNNPNIYNSDEDYEISKTFLSSLHKKTLQNLEKKSIATLY